MSGRKISGINFCRYGGTSGDLMPSSRGACVSSLAGYCYHAPEDTFKRLLPEFYVIGFEGIELFGPDDGGPLRGFDIYPVNSTFGLTGGNFTDFSRLVKVDFYKRNIPIFSSEAKQIVDKLSDSLVSKDEAEIKAIFSKRELRAYEETCDSIKRAIETTSSFI